MDRTNDFAIKIATVNGTGSASANTLLMKSIFRSGIPVMGKNYFPSNIQGLPTWYEIRVTKDGYVARSGKIHLMVAMNAETYARDVREVASGGYLLYDSTWPRPALLARDDITVLGVPLAKLCNENFNGVRTRILMKNICYAGVLAALLDLDLEQVRALLAETYAKKPQLVDSNMKAIQLGYDYAKANLPCPLPLKVAPLDKTKGHIMIDGNTAAGLGCVFAGGSVRVTAPPGTSCLNSSPAWNGSNPACFSSWNASSLLRPVTSGTGGSGSGPFDTMIVTWPPMVSWLPADGVVRMTAPCGTSAS